MAFLEHRILADALDGVPNHFDIRQRKRGRELGLGIKKLKDEMEEEKARFEARDPRGSLPS